MWTAFDVASTGEPFHSLTHTRELAAELGRERGAERAARALPAFLEAFLGSAVYWSGLIGALIGAAMTPERARAPLIVGGVGVAAFFGLGVAGASLLPRYVLIPGAALGLMAAIAVAGWQSLPKHEREKRGSWMLCSIVLAVAWAAAAPRDIADVGHLRHEANTRQALQEDLDKLLRSAAARPLRETETVVFVTAGRVVPWVAYWLRRDPRTIVVVGHETPPRSRSSVLIAPVKRPDDLYLMTRFERRVRRSAQIENFCERHGNRSWRLLASCS
jgi:hypothetical protein